MLPEPIQPVTLPGDLLTQIATLMAESARDDRKNARKAADAEERVIVAEARKRVAEMRAKADAVEKEGWVGGLTQALGGAMSAGGAAFFPVAAAGEKAWDKALAAGGETTQGLGQIVARGHAAEQVQREAAASEHEAAAAAAARRQRNHDDDAAAASDFVRRILELVAEVQRAKQGATSAAVIRA
jgi:hypothetical protein